MRLFIFTIPRASGIVVGGGGAGNCVLGARRCDEEMATLSPKLSDKEVCDCFSGLGFSVCRGFMLDELALAVGEPRGLCADGVTLSSLGEAVPFRETVVRDFTGLIPREALYVPGGTREAYDRNPPTGNVIISFNNFDSCERYACAVFADLVLDEAGRCSPLAALALEVCGRARDGERADFAVPARFWTM